MVSCDDEESALEAGTLLVQTGTLFGPWDHDHFVARGLALLRQGREWVTADDQIVLPTYLPDLVQASLDLLIDGETGVWHLTNGEYEPMDISPEARHLLQPGAKITLAVHCHQTTGGQGVDVGLAVLPPSRLSIASAAMWQVCSMSTLGTCARASCAIPSTAIATRPAMTELAA